MSKTKEGLAKVARISFENIVETSLSTVATNDSLKPSPALVKINEISRSGQIASRCRPINSITNETGHRILEDFFKRYKDNESFLIEVKIKGSNTTFSISNNRPKELEQNFDRFLGFKNIEEITVTSEKIDNNLTKNIVTFRFWDQSTEGFDLIWLLLRKYLVPKTNQ